MPIPPRVVVVAVLAGACGSDDARVSAEYQRDPIVPRAQTTVTLSDGEHTHTLSGAQLFAAPKPRYPTRTRGTLVVAVAMADAAGPIARGTLELPLRADWIYGISIAVDSLDPAGQCFGCQGSRAFALRSGVGRSPKDSLWLTWGGNSLSSPVIY